MEQLKYLIFETLQMEQKEKLTGAENMEIFTEDFKRLVFGLFKENAKTKQINPCVWLYLNNNTDAFKDILADIVHECYINFLEDKETAYKNTLKYVYHNYYKTQTKHRPLDNYTDKLTITISKNKATTIVNSYIHKIQANDKKEYYKTIIERTKTNLEKQKRVFINGRQKEQTINKLKKLGIYEILA